MNAITALLRDNLGVNLIKNGETYTKLEEIYELSEEFIKELSSNNIIFPSHAITYHIRYEIETIEELNYLRDSLDEIYDALLEVVDNNLDPLKNIEIFELGYKDYE